MFTTGLWIFCLTANQTKAKDSRSDFKSINASIIKGSGLGPAAYILNASDLCSAHQSNLILKYADDTGLIVPDTHLHTIPLELQHISDWANRHNLKLNQSKSKEMILSLHNGPVSTVTCLTRVESLTVLGVTFNSKLWFDSHFAHIIDKAARTCTVWRPFELMVLLGNLHGMLPEPH